MSGQVFEKLHQQAGQILELMRTGGVSPTPTNYEVLYRHVAGGDPALCEAIDAEIAKQGRLTPASLDRVRRQFFGECELSDHASTIDSAQNQLSMVVKYLQSAGEDAGEYKAQLATGEAALNRLQISGENATIIQEIAASTTAMIERTQRLEARLAVSTQEIMVLKQDLEKARSESRTDALTGLANRKAFESAIEVQTARALVDKKPFCVAFCDIDHFKLFNDKWGHALGDEVLRLVAQCLERQSHGIGLAARYGGEEFVVLLPQKDLAAATDICEQMCDYVSSRKIRSRSGTLDLGRVTLSIGVAALTWADTIETLLERADSALYRAKNMGRNQVRTELDLADQGQSKVAAKAH